MKVLSRPKSSLLRRHPRADGEVRGLILLYHRIAELERDPMMLSVTPEHFRQHLEILRRDYRIVALSDLPDALADGNEAAPPVAITFDDGYADFVQTAMPMLTEYDAPATVFVTTGRIDSPLETWWDDLERLILVPLRLPRQLKVRLNRRVLTWHLDGGGGRHNHWNIAHRANPTVRHSIYRSLTTALGAMPPDAQRCWLDTLAAWADLPRKGRLDYMGMTAPDIAALAKTEQCAIGAHTVHHPILGMLSARKQVVEIVGSKSTLEGMTRQPVNVFSYPCGRREDYTSRTVDLVDAAGFGLACANSPRPVTRHTDPLQLPRVVVRNWTPARFEAMLSQFQTGAWRS